MNRQEFIELSPWLLNGSLSESEREELLAQLKESVESRTDLADTAFVASLFAHRPSTETLIALAHDEPISPVEQELFDLQQELDPEIAAELELARMSRRLLEDEDIALLPIQRLPVETGPVERAAGQAAEPPAVDFPTTAAMGASEAEVVALPVQPRTLGWRLLAAAALAALLPTALWLHSEQQVREMQAAQTLTPSWTEINLGRVRGGGAADIWQSERGALAEIYPEDSNTACSSCTVEITSIKTGRVAYSGSVEMQRGFYQLQMHLLPGRYRVAIYAGESLPTADRSEAETDFEIEIVDASSDQP